VSGLLVKNTDTDKHTIKCYTAGTEEVSSAQTVCVRNTVRISHNGVATICREQEKRGSRPWHDHGISFKKNKPMRYLPYSTYSILTCFSANLFQQKKKIL